MTHEQYLDLLKWLDKRISLIICYQNHNSDGIALDLLNNEDAGRAIFVTHPDDEED